MDYDESSNLFEGIPALNEAEPDAVDGISGADSMVYKRENLMILPKEKLVGYALQLQRNYQRIENDMNVLSWEFQESQDSLTYFSRVAKLAHNLNASDLETVAQIATTEIPAYFHCGYAALFLYDSEEKCFKLASSSLPSNALRHEPRHDPVLAELFNHGDYPFLAEYFKDRGCVLVEDGLCIKVEVHADWIRAMGKKILVFPFRVKQADSRDYLNLGGLILGNARRELEAKDAEVAMIFSELLSSSLLNAQLMRRLNDLIIIDPLTQIFNRRHLIDQLTSAMIQAQRHGHTLSIAMIDIDFFKRFNDKFGHICGDGVLREVANILKSGVRAGVDIPARYGGEEFMLVMPFTNLDSAVEVADRIRKLIKSSTLDFEGEKLSVTCSFGVAEYVPGETVERFVDRADASLYQAKKTGRDRVCAASGSTPSS